MPKPYVPTGRPPGRPAKPREPEITVQDVVVRLKDRTTDRRYLPMDAICPIDWPEGWPLNWRIANCEHGTWVKR